MKRILLALAILIAATLGARAQTPVSVIGPVVPGDCVKFNSTTVLADNGTTCNNGAAATPGGVNGAIQYNSGGNFGGFVMNGDCLTNTATGAIICTKTNGAAFLTPGGSSGNVQTNNGSGGLAGITNTQLTALCQTFSSVLSGCAPASGGGTANFLRADGTWAVPGGIGLGTAGYALIGNGASASTYQGFAQPGTGAITRTWNSKVSDYISVRDFGAKGDASTDDTAAIQAAITYAESLGGVVPCIHLGPGQFVISAQLNIARGDCIIGDGESNSIIIPNSGVTALSVNSINAVDFENFQIAFANNANWCSNTGISFPSDGTNRNYYSVIRNVKIVFAGVGIATPLISNFDFDGIFISSQCATSTGFGLRLDTSGDSTVANSILGANYAVIGCSDCAGLRVVNNKFSGGFFSYGFLLTQNRADGDLWITGNSFESCSVYCVYITTQPGINFGTIQISGNEFAATSSGASGVVIGGPVTIGEVSIQNNQFFLTATGTSVALTKVSVFTVNGNMFVGGAVGISTDAASSTGVVGPNIYTSVTTRTSLSSAATATVTCTGTC